MLLSLWGDGEAVQTIRQALVFFQNVGMSVKSVAQRTREEYTYDVSELIEFLEARGVSELSKVRLRELQAYSRELEKRGLSRSSRNRKVDAIKSFFRFLSEQEIVRYDPAE